MHQPQQGANNHPGSSGLQSQICWVATLLQAASMSGLLSARLRQTCWAGLGLHQPAELLPVLTRQQTCWVGLRQPRQRRGPLPAPSSLPESLHRGMQQLQPLLPMLTFSASISGPRQRRRGLWIDSLLLTALMGSQTSSVGEQVTSNTLCISFDKGDRVQPHGGGNALHSLRSMLGQACRILQWSQSNTCSLSGGCVGGREGICRGEGASQDNTRQCSLSDEVSGVMAGHGEGRGAMGHNMIQEAEALQFAAHNAGTPSRPAVLCCTRSLLDWLRCSGL